MSEAKSLPDLSMEEILASIRRIIAEDEHPAGGAAAGEPLCLIAGGDEAILELTEAINEDGSIRRLTGFVEPMPVADRPTETEPAAAATSALGEPDSEAHPEPPSVVAREASVPDASVSDIHVSGTLVSDASAAAIAASFAQVADLPEPAAEPQTPMLGEHSLDDVVRELLRPLLRAWLDEHLPPLVERLVTAEITRIRGRSPTR